MTIICSIILFITWSFSFLIAIRISKVPGHYIKRKILFGTRQNIWVYVEFCAKLNGPIKRKAL